MSCSTELSYRNCLSEPFGVPSDVTRASTGGLAKGAPAAMLLAGLLASVAAAHAGAWVSDGNSGCQVWNPNPQLDETVVWSGSCVNGRAEGPGTVRWSHSGTPGELDEGEWRGGRQVNRGTQSWSAGRYEGELSESEPNGRGVLTLKNLRYEGDFRNGKPNGMGTLTAGHESISGSWKDGCLQGPRRASIGVPLAVCRDSAGR
jgi:hypothetical protein